MFSLTFSTSCTHTLNAGYHNTHSLDVDKWVAAGFDRELAKQFVNSIFSNLNSKNVVVEARFPKAGEIISILDKEVNQ